MSKLTKADLKRLEDLKRQLDIQKKKIEDDKKKIAKQKKDLAVEDKKLKQGWKDLKNAQKQFANDKKFYESKNAKNKLKMENRKSGGGGGAWQQKYMDMKKVADREGKSARDYKKKCDQLEAEMKVLKRKLKNLSGKRKGKEDPRIKSLKKENKMLKKKLRMLMKELAKKRRWFQRTIKLFKSNQNAWIKKQQDAFKDKKIIIKYVFLDDVKRITQYGRPGRDKWRFKKRIKVRTKGGGEVVLKDVDVVILDGDFMDNDDDTDTDTDGTGKKKKGKKKGKKGGNGDDADDSDASKKKKRKKKGGNIDDDDGIIVGETVDDDGSGNKKKKKKGKKTAEDRELEIERYMEELENEFGLLNDEALGDDDEYKTDPELDALDDLDDTDADDDDNKDNENKNDNNDDDDDDDDNDGGNEALEAQIVALNQESESRNDDLKKLQDILNDKDKYPDPVVAAQELAKEIETRQDEVANNLKGLGASNTMMDNFKDHGKNYSKFILNLSKSIAGNSVNFDKLVTAYDYFTRELKGRIDDLITINKIYYSEINDDEYKDDSKTPFDILKDTIITRHKEIKDAIDAVNAKNSNDDADESKDDTDVDDDNNDATNETNKNEAKVKEIYDGLVSNNVEYNGTAVESSTKYDTSQNVKAQLVSEFYERYKKVENLIQKINKVPATKIDFESQEPPPPSDAPNDDDQPKPDEY